MIGQSNFVWICDKSTFVVSSMSFRLVAFGLLLCFLEGFCFIPFGHIHRNKIVIPSHFVNSQHLIFNLRATDDSAEGLKPKGFSDRREKQKLEALQRQKAKELKRKEGEPPASGPADSKFKEPADSAGEAQSDPLRFVPDGPPQTANSKTLEKLKEATMREKEERIQKAEAKRTLTKSKGLPFVEEARQIPDAVLFGIERTLLIGVCIAGLVWLVAGAGTAYDAFMVATKQPVPAGVDAALGEYVEPLLTPGLLTILGCSSLLGLLQVYKFEGARKQRRD